MIRKVLNTLFILLFGLFCLHGQKGVVRDIKEQSIAKSQSDSLRNPFLLADSSLFANDTLPLNAGALPGKDYKISNDAPDSEIVYGAKGKKWFDIENNLVHLYEDAFVDYGKLKLKADYIVFDFKNNIATAEAKVDSAGNLTQKAQFTEGESNFEYRKLRYNFKTQKGFVYNTFTTEGELFLIGDKTKIVSAESDSTMKYDQLFNQNAIISSCDLDHPHFGIRASKLKVVPEQLAVLGPARLELAGIPTPLILPFGFFPLVQGKSSGLIFPDNYEYSDAWGFGLQNIGYYFGINDYIDMKVTGDIYLRGSWGLQTQTTYKRRYKYNGGLTMAYASRLTESSNSLEFSKNTSFAIRWNHNQDSKAHPYRKWGGSINMEFGKYTNDNDPSFNALSNNKRRSNFSYSHTMPGTPLSFSASLNHSQDINTGVVTMTAPNMQLRMNQIYPFKRKVVKGKQKWYESITLTGSAEAKNYVKTSDSTFLTQQTFDDMEYGVKYKASSGTSFKILKYFNFNPSINYDETWYFKRNNIELLDSNIVNSSFLDVTVAGDTLYQRDTIFGVQQATVDRAFVPYRNFNAGASLSTTIFGTKKFSKGKLRGIRHVIKPSVSMNYQPVNRDRYIDSVATDLRGSFLDAYDIYEEYEILPSGVFGAPNLNSLGAFSINYRFKNDLEAKYFAKKDSTIKNIKVFNNWNISGNYNIYADSLKFSKVNFTTGSTSFLKGMITLGFNMSLDPYAINEKGRRVDEFYYNSTKSPLRFDQMNLTINTGFTVKRLRALIAGIGEEPDQRGETDEETEEEQEEQEEKSKLKKQESLLDLFDNFRISHSFRYTGRDQVTNDTFFVSTNTVSLRGNLKLTDNWSINVGNIGYDFRNKGLSYPDFGFDRKLHCWNMRFSWQPQRGTYTFFIGVTSGTLNFLKTNYNQNIPDSSFR